MGAFRYEAVEASGNAVTGVIEADDRKSAVRLLSTRGIFASQIEACAADAARKTESIATADVPVARRSFKFGSRIRRKEITAFTRGIAALLSSAIPIPNALDGLGEEEENPALKEMVLEIGSSVRKGIAFSSALEAHPREFSKLYVSMVRVGEEAGALPAVMNDLASLLEHDEEVRSEVFSAIAYPVFVLGFGFVTVAILLTVVLPRLFSMLQDMAKTLPLPTVILLRTSAFLHSYWYVVLLAVVALSAAIYSYSRDAKGALVIDRLKLRLPILGGVYLSSALARFSRTLGTLTRSGVSLLPALKIVENTIGNLALARFVAQVSEETRGGDSLARPLRKLGVFPKTAIQMIDVGEESGKLPEMLLKIAEIQERDTRARTKTLVSLLAPVLILIVGAVIGFIVIAILLPIFNMSRSLH